MPLPKEVQRQGDRADEILRQQSSGPEGPETGQSEGAPEAGPEPAQKAPEELTPEEANAELQAPTQSGSETESEWERKYRILKGKYDAEIPRLNQENYRLRQELESLQQQVEQLRNQPTPSPAPEGGPSPQGAPNPDVEVLREEYGDRIADQFQAFQAQIQEKDRQIAELKGNLEQLQQGQQATAEQHFWQRLGETVPDWQEINNSQAFYDWLGQTDEFSGKIRQALLDEAYQSLDPERVSAIFQAFKQEQSAAPPNPRQQELESQVAPAEAGGGYAPSGESKPYWTTSQVHDFYEQVAKGRYRDMPERYRQIDQEITEAQNDGRIVPG